MLLAVYSFVLQIDFAFSCALSYDICLHISACRQGSSDEVALLVAEFGLLDQQLANLAAAVEQSSAILITEEELIPVASEIPDLLTRLGIAYVVFLLCYPSLLSFYAETCKSVLHECSREEKKNLCQQES